MSAQQDARDAAEVEAERRWPTRLARIPGIFSTTYPVHNASRSAFIAGAEFMWRLRGEADRAAVEKSSGPVMIGGEAIASLYDTLAAIAELDEEQR